MPESAIPALRLITIPFSHYCEKARWALDRLNLPYVEEGHLPLFHYLALWRHGGRKTVPLLLAGSAVYRDSTDILRYLDTLAPDPLRLYPRGPQGPRGPAVLGQVEELEELFDTDLGPAVRRVVYFHLLPERQRILQLMRGGVPRIEEVLLRLFVPVMQRLIHKGLRVTKEGVARSREKLWQVFGRVGDVLSDGRPYLAGDRFTAADLTFAALASPLLQPAHHPNNQRASRTAPLLPALAEEIASLRDTAAGAFGLRMYQDHRGAKQP